MSQKYKQKTAGYATILMALTCMALILIGKFSPDEVRSVWIAMGSALGLFALWPLYLFLDFPRDFRVLEVKSDNNTVYRIQQKGFLRWSDRKDINRKNVEFTDKKEARDFIVKKYEELEITMFQSKQREKVTVMFNKKNMHEEATQDIEEKNTENRSDSNAAQQDSSDNQEKDAMADKKDKKAEDTHNKYASPSKNIGEVTSSLRQLGNKWKNQQGEVAEEETEEDVGEQFLDALSANTGDTVNKKETSPSEKDKGDGGAQPKYSPVVAQQKSGSPKKNKGDNDTRDSQATGNISLSKENKYSATTPAGNDDKEHTTETDVQNGKDNETATMDDFDELDVKVDEDGNYSLG